MSPFPLTKTASEWCKENIGDNEMIKFRCDFCLSVEIEKGMQKCPNCNIDFIWTKIGPLSKRGKAPKKGY